MARYRDVTSVLFGSALILAVQSAEVTFSGDVLEGSGDDATSLRYAGITGVSAELSVESQDFAAAVGGATLRVGRTDTGSWSAPAATPGGTGVSVAFTGGLMTSIAVSVGHATLGTINYTVTVVAAQGNVSPFSIGGAGIAPGATGAKGTTPITGATFARDIELLTVAGQSFTGPNVMSMELTWEGTIIGPDSSDKDFWRTFVGVGKTNVRGTVTMRDINRVLKTSAGGDSEGPLGRRGLTSFNAVLGSDANCRPGANKSIKVANANISGIRAGATHGDLAEGSIDFIAVGNTTEVARINMTGAG